MLRLDGQRGQPRGQESSQQGIPVIVTGGCGRRALGDKELLELGRGNVVG